MKTIVLKNGKEISVSQEVANKISEAINCSKDGINIWKDQNLYLYIKIDEILIIY